MDALEAIRTRRSVRTFKPDPVPEDVLHAILDAGAYAPSAKNVRNWRFVVLEGEAKEAIVRAMAEVAGGMDQGSVHSVGGTVRAMQQAPVLITIHNTGALVRFLRRAWPDFDREAGADGFGVARDLEIQGLSAAIQNMLLAAHAQGLGGLWIGDFHYARDQIQALLEELCPFEMIAAIAIGYPSGPTPGANRPWQDVTIRADRL